MSTIVALENLTNDDLKKCLASQIALEDWTDECSKCGYPKLLHKDYALHRDAACTREMEVPNILRDNWKEFNKRVKPILKIMKEEMKKDMEQGVILQGLKELITSNTESIKTLFNYNTKKKKHPPLMTLPFPPQEQQSEQNPPKFPPGLRTCP